MSTQQKGKCKYCGKEYTRGHMIRHLAACQERKAVLDAKIGKKQSGYFQLVISYKYNKAYWLIIEVRETATLRDVDDFLRDIWLECCGHLSAFNIYGTEYAVSPDSDNFWGEPSKSMNYKLKTVIQKDMIMKYEYDFGSTTDLVIKVQNYEISCHKKDKLTILSRNNPLELLCDKCHTKLATMICTECMYDGVGSLCDDCSKTHECGEEVQLNVCNSPRMGVCGYTGSNRYPDQFVPDSL